MATDVVIIHQMLMGRDIALDKANPIHRMAQSMENFCYLIQYNGKEAVLVDGAWDINGILKYAATKGLKITKAIFTHRHLDHTGGQVVVGGNQKITVPGLGELDSLGIPCYVGKEDAEFTRQQTKTKNVIAVQDNDVIVPDVIRILHTPGHTFGSICVLVRDEALITGDTLFIGSCGRTDLQESDGEQMMASLLRLSKLPASIRVLPGHNYAPSLQESTIARESKTNFAMLEAMNRGNLSMNKLSASIQSTNLPDYLEAARRALYENSL